MMSLDEHEMDNTILQTRKQKFLLQSDLNCQCLLFADWCRKAIPDFLKFEIYFIYIMRSCKKFYEDNIQLEKSNINDS